MNFIRHLQSKSLLSPLVGSASVTMLLGDGDVRYFLAIWLSLFTFLAVLQNGMARLLELNKIRGWVGWQETGFLTPQNVYYFLLGLPLVTIISDIFSFRQNAFIVIILIVVVFVATAPLWTYLYLRFFENHSFHSKVFLIFQVLLVLTIFAGGLLLRLKLAGRGLPYEYYWDEP